MKKLLDLTGVKILTKEEQKNVSGGGYLTRCAFSADSSTDWCCHLPQGCP